MTAAAAVLLRWLGGGGGVDQPVTATSGDDDGSYWRARSGGVCVSVVGGAPPLNDFTVSTAAVVPRFAAACHRHRCLRHDPATRAQGLTCGKWEWELRMVMVMIRSLTGGEYRNNLTL